MRDGCAFESSTYEIFHPNNKLSLKKFRPREKVEKKSPPLIERDSTIIDTSRDFRPGAFGINANSENLWPDRHLLRRLADLTPPENESV